MGLEDKSAAYDSPSPHYRQDIRCNNMIQERDVMVPMRDGVRLCVDIYRPGAEGKDPALLAIARHNKDLQTPEVAGVYPPQPAWTTMWSGSLEAEDTKYLVSKGYAHIVGNVRGSGKSEDGALMRGIMYR